VATNNNKATTTTTTAATNNKKPSLSGHMGHRCGVMIGGQQQQQHLVRATSSLATTHSNLSAMRTMERREESGIGNGVDSVCGVGNGVDRGCVEVVVDAAHQIPARDVLVFQVLLLLLLL